MSLDNEFVYCSMFIHCVLPRVFFVCVQGQIRVKLKLNIAHGLRSGDKGNI